MIEGLQGIRHPISGRPLIARLGTREEVFPGPFQALAPDVAGPFTLELALDAPDLKATNRYTSRVATAF